MTLGIKIVPHLEFFGIGRGRIEIAGRRSSADSDNSLLPEKLADVIGGHLESSADAR